MGSTIGFTDTVELKNGKVLKNVNFTETKKGVFIGGRLYEHDEVKFKVKKGKKVRSGSQDPFYIPVLKYFGYKTSEEISREKKVKINQTLKEMNKSYDVDRKKARIQGYRSLNKARGDISKEKYKQAKRARDMRNRNPLGVITRVIKKGTPKRKKRVTGATGGYVLSVNDPRNYEHDWIDRKTGDKIPYDEWKKRNPRE